MERKEENFRQSGAENKAIIIFHADYCAPSGFRLKSEALNRTAEGGELAEGKSRTRRVGAIRLPNTLLKTHFTGKLSLFTD